MNHNNIQQNTSFLSNIDSTLETVSSNVDTLAKNKIIFNARLNDGTGGADTLTRSDYTSSPINFTWQNDKEKPVYIYKYNFAYDRNTDSPQSHHLYHTNPAWETKIGALNSDETDYEAPYITKNNNTDYFDSSGANSAKQNWLTDQGWIFSHDFTQAPIEIGVSRKFGHYIAGNIQNGGYDTEPIGIIEGYFYDS